MLRCTPSNSEILAAAACARRRRLCPRGVCVLPMVKAATFDDAMAVRNHAAAPAQAKAAKKRAPAKASHTSAHFKPDPKSSCAACRGRHRKHTCGKVVLVQAPKAGCPACRGRHRAHTCGLRS